MIGLKFHGRKNISTILVRDFWNSFVKPGQERKGKKLLTLSNKTDNQEMCSTPNEDASITIRTQITIESPNGIRS